MDSFGRFTIKLPIPNKYRTKPSTCKKHKINTPVKLKKSDRIIRVVLKIGKVILLNLKILEITCRTWMDIHLYKNYLVQTPLRSLVCTCKKWGINQRSRRRLRQISWR